MQRGSSDAFIYRHYWHGTSARRACADFARSRQLAAMRVGVGVIFACYLADSCVPLVGDFGSRSALSRSRVSSMASSPLPRPSLWSILPFRREAFCNVIDRATSSITMQKFRYRRSSRLVSEMALLRTWLSSGAELLMRWRFMASSSLPMPSASASLRL